MSKYLWIISILIIGSSSLTSYCGNSVHKEVNSFTIISNRVDIPTEIVFTEHSFCNDDVLEGDQFSIIVVDQDGCFVGDKVANAIEHGWGGIILQRKAQMLLGLTRYDLRFKKLLDEPIIAVETDGLIIDQECHQNLTIDIFTFELNEIAQYVNTPQYYFISVVLILLNSILLVASVISLIQNAMRNTMELLGGSVIIACVFAGVFGVSSFVVDFLYFSGYIVILPIRAILFEMQLPLVLFANGIIISSFFSASTVDVSSNWVQVARRILLMVSIIALVLFVIGFLSNYLIEIMYIKSLTMMRYVVATWYVITIILYFAMMLVTFTKLPNKRNKLLKKILIVAYMCYIFSFIGLFATPGHSSFFYPVNMLYLSQVCICLWCVYFTRPNRFGTSKSSKTNTIRSKKTERNTVKPVSED
eukprot:TRINITY_DN9227_c0_g1_i1.p1 TRINITY_DN9227_c0_g1~~TRINITY_DN9227_c0_g1_i1.p1  ORF type:complete len:417 (-),score=34.90 TRINITY_DN9227_c0_g1_i1:60-1310(-)